MPLPEQRDVREIEAVLNEVLSTRLPPVARCRMLSSGFGTTHALNIAESLLGDLCDACVLVCPQVDTTIKHYVVNHRMVEVMARVEPRTGDAEEPDLDLFLEEAADLS